MEEKILQIIQENFGNLASQMKKGFDLMNQKFEGVNERFEGINKRFDRIEQRLDIIEQRLDIIEQRLDEHDKQFESINNYLIVMEHNILEKISALFDGYEANHQQIEIIKNRLNVLEDREKFNSIKISILEEKLR